jgi:ParB/RepB/Spo0J family partition protein
MATTASEVQDTPAAAADISAVQLRHVPLAGIVVPEGFNPRGAVADDGELEQLAETIRQHGCLQPIRVRASDDGAFVLIAGERRYRAAVKAGLAEIPAIVRPAGSGEEDERAELLVEALIENDQRRDLDPLARALGYQRLLDSGLTVNGVAQRVTGAQTRAAQARVREHLRILKLPEQLQGKVAAGEIPMRAVKPLAEVAAIHPDLAVVAVREVLEPSDSWEECSWADVERAPLEVALAANELPDGIYRTHSPYRIDRFALSDGAKRDLEALERMLGRAVEAVRFDAGDVEQARRLGTARGDGSYAVIVGADVAAQLVADQLARAVKEQRQRVREERRVEPTSQNGSQSGGGAATAPAADAEEADREADREAEEARRAEREAERQARERATLFNLELGRAVFTTLSHVRVDEDVLKVLASVDVVGDLGDVAMRGARYGLPGWVREVTQRNGKTKYVYLERAEAEAQGNDYLAGAVKASEIAGRQLALLVMAVYADQDAVAASNRSWHHVKVSGPWAGEFDQLLDGIVREKLPDSAVTLLEPVLAKRREQHEERAEARKAREQAAARLEAIEDRIGELTVEQVEQAERDLEQAWTGWTPRFSDLRQKLAARREHLTAG